MIEAINKIHVDTSARIGTNRVDAYYCVSDQTLDVSN